VKLIDMYTHYQLEIKRPWKEK